MRAVVVVVPIAVALAACGRHEAPLPAPPAIASAAAASATSSASAATSPSAPPIAWAEAVRLEKWDAAARALDALSDAEKARAEVRYVRARVALAKGDAATALPLLDGLEKALPLLADAIAQHRAEAQLEVGPFKEAGEYFAARQGAGSQLEAARAFEKAKEPARARAACEHVVSAQRKSRATEAQARAIRLHLVDKPGAVEIVDARWLAVNAPDLAAGASVEIGRIDPAHPLTAQELMKRADALDDGGKVDEALRAIDQAASAPRPAVPERDRTRAKGYVLYHHGRYVEAQKLLAQAAAMGGDDAPEDAFHAARALSRADKDDEAIAAYEKVARTWPRSRWGEKAMYFVPYLHILHAEWQAAQAGFDEYAKRYPSPSEKDAPRFRAIAHLMTKDYKGARAQLERLAGEEPDAQTSARLFNLAALAALGDGDRTHAVSRWQEVARSRPLSYAAIVARARLAKLGEPIPPAIDPPTASSAHSPTVALPPPVDMLHAIGLDEDAEDALHAREGAVAAGSGEARAELLCTAYGMLSRARRRYQLANQSVPAALLGRAPDDGNRWAWECAFPSPYASAVEEAERKEELPQGLVYAVMRQESGYDPDAVSPAHAYGLLQVLPETGKTLAEDLGLPPPGASHPLTSPPYNIALGAHYLRGLVARFRGQLPLAIGAYNCGPEAIARWAQRDGGMETDVYVERIPYKETRDYVGRVMGNLARYGYLARGEDGVPKIDLAITP